MPLAKPKNAPAPRRLMALALLAGLVPAAQAAAAQDEELPRLRTNEQYVEEAARPTQLAVDDPMAVFAFVFDSLPDRVKVYPTENYYYFTFINAGIPYAGNIRIEPHERDVAVHLAYYEDTSEWREETDLKHIVLDASRGVTLEKVERSFNGKQVDFALNDLSAVKPPPGSIAADEKFIGPIFDESGIRFFLVYNSNLKLFHYVLDETIKVADQFFPSERTDRILIGKRTGFAFYRDHRLDRKIMIGAYEGNMRLNNYFDGPFDQLPDNFIEGEVLRDAILQVEPDLKGQIDRFGSSPDGEVRFMISPYLPYKKIADLNVFHRCATGRLKSPTYYECFDAEKLGVHGPDTRPEAMRRKPSRKLSATAKRR